MGTGEARVLDQNGSDITDRVKNLSREESYKLGSEPKDLDFSVKEAQESGLSPMAYYGVYTKSRAQSDGLSPMAYYGVEGDQSAVQTESEDRGWRGPPLMGWQGPERPEEGVPAERAKGFKDDSEVIIKEVGESINISSPVNFPELPSIDGDKIKYVLYAIGGLIGIGLIGYVLQGLGTVTSSAAILKGSGKGE